MNAEANARPTVSIAYVMLTIQLAEERGVTRERLLNGVGLESELLAQPEARIPLLQYGHIIARALHLTGEPGLGLEYGLRANLTMHGLVGFGVMSHGTLREALSFGKKYFTMRSPGFTCRCFADGAQAVIDTREAVQHGPLRHYAFDMLLVGLTHTIRPFVPEAELELWFEWPEPDYYVRYRDRLPRTRFDTGANQLRFPVEYLDRPLAVANPVTVEMLKRQCDRELEVTSADDQLLYRVRMLLADTQVPLDLEETARKLSMSSRTLKRKLRAHGFKFRELLDEVRRTDSMRLLHETRLSVEEIGRRVGYTAHGNFIRAFRRWTGTTPGEFRARVRSAGPN
ncbi:MAG TPA: AraC family transcriptional regulator [Polyangiaceae bacterium]|nr:AraC family transcriptional regulator [Polyangiaceae bacterium]